MKGGASHVYPTKRVCVEQVLPILKVGCTNSFEGVLRQNT